MVDEDLKLNDLSKFSKSSRRLILREYSNCEVPAGCGGVVFRWKNPDDAIAFETLSFILGEFELFLDGNTPQSACPLLERGEHILSLVISNFQSNYGFLMFAGRSGESGASLFYEGDRKVRILSSPDSSWKFLLNAPMEESWTGLKFDDSSWNSMIFKNLPTLDKKDSRRFEIDSLSGYGAQSLGIEEVAPKTIWIRKRFSL